MYKTLLILTMLVVGILVVAAVKMATNREVPQWETSAPEMETSPNAHGGDAFEEGERQLDEREEAVERARENIRLITRPGS